MRRVRAFDRLIRNGFPFPPRLGPPPLTEAERLRLIARRHGFAAHRGVKRWLAAGVATLGMTALTLRQALFPPRFDGRPLVPAGLGARLRLLRRALRLGVLPLDLHARSARMGDADLRHVIFDVDSAGLYRFLNAPRLPDWVPDKAAFARWASEHGVPSPPVLPPQDDAEVRRTAEAGGVVIKPARGMGSAGVTVITRTQGGWHGATRQGHRVDADLDRALARAPRGADTLVQPFFRAQAQAFWIDETADRPAWPLYVRLVTGRDATGRARPLAAFYTINADTSVIPRRRTDGCVALDTGTLQPPQGGTLPPGAAGAVVPGFTDAAALLAARHAATPEAVLLGWDVLFDGAGFTVLEVNTSLSLALFEIAFDTPLGHTPVMPVLASYLKD